MINTKQYKIEKGVCYKNGKLFDSRIDNSYLIEDSEERLILESISMKKQQRIALQNREKEKKMMKYLIQDDFLKKKFCIGKIVISSESIVGTVIKIFSCFCIFYLCTYFLMFAMSSVLDVSSEFLEMGIKVLWFSIFFHELGHIFVYYFLEKDNFFYVVISLVQMEVVTKETKMRHTKLIALGGPLFSIFVNIVFYIICDNAWFVFVTFFHMLFLTPLTQDGRNIWYK